MTFLTAAQSAAIRLVGRKPSVFFSSTAKFELEICDLVNDVLADIVKYGDWRSLIQKQQMPGDGVTTAFDLPDGYDRMPKNADVTRANWYTWGYVDAPDLNFWNDLVNGLAAPSPGYWIILNGQMQFIPPVSSGDTAQFYYVSKNAVLDADNAAPKSAFTKDGDTFLLDDSLLTLGLIWRWRAQKRLEYAEDLRNYEIRIQTLSGNDKGARVQQIGSRSANWDANWAYPRNLGV